MFEVGWQLEAGGSTGTRLGTSRVKARRVSSSSTTTPRTTSSLKTVLTQQDLTIFAPRRAYAPCKFGFKSQRSFQSKLQILLSLHPALLTSDIFHSFSWVQWPQACFLHYWRAHDANISMVWIRGHLLPASLIMHYFCTRMLVHVMSASFKFLVSTS